MIFISAGHHKDSKGASFDGVYEYDFTVPWADKIAELLDGRCVRVPDGHLKDKIEFINDRIEGRSLAVEIHFNSAKKWIDADNDGLIDPGEMVDIGKGSESLYYPGRTKDSKGSIKGKKAAAIMQDSLSRMFPPNRGAKPGWYKMNPANGPDYFLWKTNCTAIIVEPEFIDNLSIISDNEDKACHLIADTLLEIEAELI